MEIFSKYFDKIFSTSGTIFLIFMGAILLILLLIYIFSSVGLMTMSKRLGEKGGWMAWFPIVNAYLLGKTAWTKALGWTMLILSILTGAAYISINGLIVFSLSLPDSLSTIFTIILAILSLTSLFKLYKLFSRKYIVMIIFTILSVGLLSPFFIFAIRNNELNIGSLSNSVCDTK